MVQVGRIDDSEMRRTFNMGIGMVLIVSRKAATQLFEQGFGSTMYTIGEVVNGEGVTFL